jgi:hypothetical protein
VSLHDGLADSQPQAGAGDGLPGDGGGAEEALEDPPAVGVGDADAGVGDGEHRPVAIDAEPDLHPPAVGGEFHRVGEQVVEQLGGADRVEGEAGHVGGRQPQVDVLAQRLGPLLRHRVRGNLGQVRAAELHRQLPRADAGQEQQVAHQPHQPVRVALDDRQELSGVQAAGALVQQQLGVADDRGQRRPQLVRDQADELVLLPVELAHGLVLQAELAGLPRQRLLRPDLRRHVPGYPERPDDRPGGVPQRHFGGRHPRIASAVEGFSFHLSHDWLASADNLLLIVEGGGGVLIAEDIEVGLADQVFRRAARGIGGDPAFADRQEAAAQILEVHALAGRGQQVAHADEHHLALRLVVAPWGRLRRAPGYRAAPLSAATWSPARDFRRFVPLKRAGPPLVVSPRRMSAKPAGTGSVQVSASLRTPKRRSWHDGRT